MPVEQLALLPPGPGERLAGLLPVPERLGELVYVFSGGRGRAAPGGQLARVCHPLRQRVAGRRAELARQDCAQRSFRPFGVALARGQGPGRRTVR